MFFVFLKYNCKLKQEQDKHKTQFLNYSLGGLLKLGLVFLAKGLLARFTNEGLHVLVAFYVPLKVCLI